MSIYNHDASNKALNEYIKQYAIPNNGLGRANELSSGFVMKSPYDSSDNEIRNGLVHMSDPSKLALRNPKLATLKYAKLYQHTNQSRTLVFSHPDTDEIVIVKLGSGDIMCDEITAKIQLVLGN